MRAPSAYDWRRIGRYTKIIQKTKTKGGIIMESIMPIWQQFCNAMPLLILGVLGIAGIAGLIVRAIKNMIL